MTFELLPSHRRPISGKMAVVAEPDRYIRMKAKDGFVLSCRAVKLPRTEGETFYTLKFWLKGVDENAVSQFKLGLHLGRELIIKDEHIVVEKRDGREYPTVNLNYEAPKKEELTLLADSHIFGTDLHRLDP